MPAVMTPPSRSYITAKTSIQKVCIGLGVIFIVVGLAGIVMPGLMALHLSMAHNLIHLLSGALALWMGYSDNSGRAYSFCLAFGAVYGLLGIVGFSIGQPGYPGVGHMEADQNLMRVIPNVLELGTNDHIFHFLLGVIFLFLAYSWKNRGDRSIAHVQRGKLRATDRSVPNSETDLSRADLGKSDVNRASDISRRKDFEVKL